MAEAFDERGFFRTGDLVTLHDEGWIIYRDRIKDMMKVGGESVSASEVEAVIMAVPGVRETAVVSRPDPHYGEAIVAFVVLAEGAAAQTDGNRYRHSSGMPEVAREIQEPAPDRGRYGTSEDRQQQKFIGRLCAIWRSSWSLWWQRDKQPACVMAETPDRTGGAAGYASKLFARQRAGAEWLLVSFLQTWPREPA